ncbi:MAG: hypothetical protein M1819_005946 [Sarea resinae]|nr:MAG: hypothetical protein M1819_005946 [Sarea resinae]
MRRPPHLLVRPGTQLRFNGTLSKAAKPPIIRIHEATFYREHPSTVSSPAHDAPPNPPLFPKLTFELPSFSLPAQHWAVVGPSSSGKSTFLEIIRGTHLCFPPSSRSFPYLLTDEIAAKDHRLRFPGRAIQYVGFGGETGGLGGTGTRGAYLSARYESRREETDFSLLDYLQGHTELNPAEKETGQEIALSSLNAVIEQLRLKDLLGLPVSNLSNGQTRRARIARALLGKSEILLLDEPFMGLDPPTLTTLSPILHGLAASNSPRLLMSLRPQDPIPDWITHLIYLGQDFKVAHQGAKDLVLEELKKRAKRNDNSIVYSAKEVGRVLTAKGILEPNSTLEAVGAGNKKNSRVPKDQDNFYFAWNPRSITEPIVEMEGVEVKYGDKEILGRWNQGNPNSHKGMQKNLKDGLWWRVRRGQKWGIFGPNGSGKTTIISLICSDHPQAYSLPIKLFGRSRLPTPGQPGISIFDLQARIGQSSPEIHAFFPRNLTVRQTLENAWADTFLSKPQLNHDRDLDVDACLRWFQHELNPSASSAPEEGPTKARTKDLSAAASKAKEKAYANFLDSDDIDWADTLRFRDLPFSSQRVALFLRAILRRPDLIILDEAFGGMDDYIRDKCMLFLEHGEGKSLSRRFGPNGKRVIESATAWRVQKLRITGMSPEQALICVSHVREEVPDVVREWMRLPEPNTGKPPSFGRLDGPLRDDHKRWEQIWAM